MYFHMKIIQGSDYEASFTVRNPDTQALLDLTSGYDILGKVGKRFFVDEMDLYTWDEPAGNVVKAVGSLKLRVPGSVSRLWTFRRVFYDVRILNTATNEEINVAHGPLTVTPTLT